MATAIGDKQVRGHGTPVGPQTYFPEADQAPDEPVEAPDEPAAPASKSSKRSAKS